MALRLSLLAALLAAVTAAPVITSSNNARFHTLRPEVGEHVNASPCDYCQNMVTTLDSFVTDPQTQAAAAEYLDAVLCTALPADWGQMCKTEVPVLVAAAAQELAASLQPGDICGAFGVCPVGGGGAAAALQGPLDCPMCKVVVVAFVARLQDPQSRAEIETNMRAACANLEEADAKARCLQDVASLFAALDNLLQDVDPEAVCQVAQFCSKDGVAAAPAPAALRALRSGVVSLATGGPAAANDDSCQSCKTIVSEVAAIMSDPKTQAEMLDYAKQSCSMFADFKDQCEAYVTLYGPLVLNMAISYLQPDSLCTTIGYCKSVDAPYMLS